MQGRGGGRNSLFDFGDPFAGFGGFGSQRSLISDFFGGRDPFDDPFFRSPFGSTFESGFRGSRGSPFPNMPMPGFLEQPVPQQIESRGPIIEELNSEDEKEEDGDKEKKENPRKHARSSKEPYVEDPDDEVEAEGRRSKQIQHRNDFNRMNNTQVQPRTQSFSFQSSTVSYGGANGAYYTSSTTRRTGSDGLTFEESKEADTAARKAAHRISRGIHNKGHSVTRNLNPDGKVDTMQTLHNLEQDELPIFDEAWKGNAQKHLPGWNDRFGNFNSNVPSIGVEEQQANRTPLALPSMEQSGHGGRRKSGMEEGTSSSKAKHSGWTKTSKRR